VRPWLVGIGAGLAVLGLLVLVAGVINLPGTDVVDHSSAFALSPLPGSSQNEVVPILSGAGPPLTVTFHSNLPVQVYLATCPGGPPPPVTCTVARTPYAEGNGTFLVGGPLAPGYYLSVSNPYNRTAGVGIMVTYPLDQPAGLPAWEATVIILAGSILTGVGALSFFLGTFLRGNPYRPRPPPGAVFSRAPGTPRGSESWKDEPPGGPP
jgi:hypothetical protein